MFGRRYKSKESEKLRKEIYELTKDLDIIDCDSIKSLSLEELEELYLKLTEK